MHIIKHILAFDDILFKANPYKAITLDNFCSVDSSLCAVSIFL